MSTSLKFQDHFENLSLSTKLTRDMAQELCSFLISEETLSHQAAALLALLSRKSYTSDEILGFRDVIMSRAKIVSINAKNAFDVCGTGGDGKSSFNISTASAFVTASSGVKVVKHGNYAVSSKCGSSNVLEALGVTLIDNVNLLNELAEKANLCFLHAPLFHPCLKSLAPVRKELGIKTIFNLLGPLLNPAKVRNQVSGVYSYANFKLYRTVLSEISDKFFVVYSKDAYDEASLTDDFYLGGSSLETLISLEDNIHFGKLNRYTQASIAAPSSVESSANLVEKILKGQADTHFLEIVAVNSALAISLAFDISLKDALKEARLLISKAEPFRTLQKVRNLC